MNSREYEQLMAELAHKLVSRPDREASAIVGWGETNKIVGASTYQHQIDVSVCSPSKMLLIECKSWAKSIDPEAVLAFAARVLDIRGANQEREVTGRIITTLYVTQGVQKIADYFDLGIDRVISIQEYAVRIWKYVGIGLAEGAIASDKFTANVRPHQ